MKMFDKRSITPPPVYTIADMKSEQVFMIGEEVYIRTYKYITLEGGCEVFYINGASVRCLRGSTVVTPIEAEFHRV